MDTINKVAEFHRIFEHPINEINGEISQELRKLRIKLIFEELEELAHAGDLKDYFTDLCENSVDNWNKADWKPDGEGKVDRIEELDALADLRYVLDGAVLALGFKDVFEEAFRLVHESNMSKLVINFMRESERRFYEDRGHVGIIFKTIDSEYSIMKRADGKILKPSTYKEVDLKHLIPESPDIPPMML